MASNNARVSNRARKRTFTVHCWTEAPGESFPGRAHLHNNRRSTRLHPLSQVPCAQSSHDYPAWLLISRRLSPEDDKLQAQQAAAALDAVVVLRESWQHSHQRGKRCVSTRIIKLQHALFIAVFPFHIKGKGSALGLADAPQLPCAGCACFQLAFLGMHVVRHVALLRKSPAHRRTRSRAKSTLNGKALKDACCSALRGRSLLVLPCSTGLEDKAHGEQLLPSKPPPESRDAVLGRCPDTSRGRSPRPPGNASRQMRGCRDVH